MHGHACACSVLPHAHAWAPHARAGAHTRTGAPRTGASLPGAPDPFALAPFPLRAPRSCWRAGSCRRPIWTLSARSASSCSSGGVGGWGPLNASARMGHARAGALYAAHSRLAARCTPCPFPPLPPCTRLPLPDPSRLPAPLLASPSPCSTWKSFGLAKGPKFALERRKQATELTAEMLAKWAGPWGQGGWGGGPGQCGAVRSHAVCRRHTHTASPRLRWAEGSPTGSKPLPTHPFE